MNVKNNYFSGNRDRSACRWLLKGRKKFRWIFGESFGGLLEMCYLCRRFSDNHKTEPDTNSKMEIYEKKHSFYAAVQLVKYAVFIALGIAMIRVGRDVLRHYPEWVWWLWLLVAAFFIIMSVAVLWSGINDKRNGSRIGMQFHRDAFYCDYLTISEQELFELLKKHID